MDSFLLEVGLKLTIVLKYFFAFSLISLYTEFNEQDLVKSISDLRKLCWEVAGVDRTQKGIISGIKSFLAGI